LYSLLKRPDEKFVTERAYEHPRFVEDLVREVGTRLRADANFPRWDVSAESFESIHTHNAYAQLSWRKT
jgi:GTP cyclohydrolase I